MIILQNISYSIGEKNILDNVSFSLGDQEKAGLVGINGVGKSTILRLMCGLLTPDCGSIIFPKSSPVIGYMPQTVGDIEMPLEQTVFNFLSSGRPIKEIEKEIAKLIDYMSKTSDETKLMAAAMKLESWQSKFELWGGYDAEYELLQIIYGMQLQDISLDAQVSTLSGGEKSKVSFSRILYSKPDVLFLDEPTNHLDQKSKKWLALFLREYPRPVLIVSHDASFLDAAISKVIRIDENTRRAEIFSCNYSKHLKILEQRREAQNRTAKKQETKERRIRKSIVKMQKGLTKKKKQVRSREKALEKLVQTKVTAVRQSKSVHAEIVATQKSGYYPVIARNIQFGYNPEKKVISGLSFTLSRDERFVIVGDNGVGKSTLLKLIAGILCVQKGELVVDSKTQVGYYAQEHENLNPVNTIIEEVSGISRLSQRNLRALLSRFLFSGDVVFQKISTLSPGEKSRLALAKLALQGRNLLLLDEPTNYLDPGTSSVICQIIREYNGTVVVVSHDVRFLETLQVQRMLLLPKGDIMSYNRKEIEKHQQG